MTAEDRELMIEEAIMECQGCGSREFPRKPNCQSCTDAVDEWIASRANAEADRIAAITREIATA